MKKVAAPFKKTELTGVALPLRWPRNTLYPQKLALTSPISGGRSVGIVRLRTKSHGVFFIASCHRHSAVVEGIRSSLHAVYHVFFFSNEYDKPSVFTEQIMYTPASRKIIQVVNEWLISPCFMYFLNLQHVSILLYTTINNVSCF
jgi:hypothetical protein